MKKPYQIVTRAAQESSAVAHRQSSRRKPGRGDVPPGFVHIVAEFKVSGVMSSTKSRFMRWRRSSPSALSKLRGRERPASPAARSAGTGGKPARSKLVDRELKVRRPRLRHKTEGEVKIPAYEKLREDRGPQQHMLGALMHGVSTREYDEVLPRMTETVGVSRSSVSRQAIEARAEQLKTLRQKCLDRTRSW